MPRRSSFNMRAIKPSSKMIERGRGKAQRGRREGQNSYRLGLLRREKEKKLVGLGLRQRANRRLPRIGVVQGKKAIQVHPKSTKGNKLLLKTGKGERKRNVRLAKWAEGVKL